MAQGIEERALHPERPSQNKYNRKANCDTLTIMETPLEIITQQSNRQALIKQALVLEGITIVWNIIEGIVAIGAGIMAHSVALIGFGADSLIETASAVILMWRLREEFNGSSTEKVGNAERKAGKAAGTLLLLLGVYLCFEAGRRLLGYEERAHTSPIGIGLTVLALMVMFILAQKKLKIADAINSKALRADAMETACCAWMSFTTLIGLVLNLAFGWWWADAAAGLVLVPLLIREGLEALKGEGCGCHDSCEK